IGLRGGKRERPRAAGRRKPVVEPLEERALLTALPVAYPDFADTDGTNPVTVKVLANDSAPSGPEHLLPGSVAVVKAPPHGNVVAAPKPGRITSAAFGGFGGPDSFWSTVGDDSGAVSAPARVTVMVHRPHAEDDGAATDGSTPVSINVLRNDTDPDGPDRLA